MIFFCFLYDMCGWCTELLPLAWHSQSSIVMSLLVVIGLSFLNTWYQCSITFVSKLTWLPKLTLFNVMAAFVMKIVGRGWIFSGISSKLENFLWTAPRLQIYTNCRPTCSLQAVVPKTCGTRQSVLHCLPNWAVLCGQRSCCFHETCQFWSMPTETSSRVFRFYVAPASQQGLCSPWTLAI